MAYNSLSDLNLYAQGSLDFTTDVYHIQPEGTKVQIRQPTWDWAKTTGNILGNHLSITHETIDDLSGNVTITFDDYNATIHNTNITQVTGNVAIDGLNSKQDWEGATMYLDVPADYFGNIQFTSTAVNSDTGKQLQWDTIVEWTNEPELDTPESMYYKYYDPYDRNWSIDHWIYWTATAPTSGSISSFPVDMTLLSDPDTTTTASDWADLITKYQAGYIYLGFDQYVWDFRNSNSSTESNSSHNNNPFFIIHNGPDHSGSNTGVHWRIGYHTYDTQLDRFNVHVSSGATSISRNTWTHFLTSFNPDYVSNQGQGELRIYQDGNLKANNVAVKLLIGPEMTLGRQLISSTHSNYFQGFMEDFRVRNRTFTEYYQASDLATTSAITPPQLKTSSSEGDVFLFNTDVILDLTLNDNNFETRDPVTIDTISGPTNFNTTTTKNLASVEYNGSTYYQMVLDINAEINDNAFSGGYTLMYPNFVANVRDDENTGEYTLTAQSENTDLVFRTRASMPGVSLTSLLGNNTNYIRFTGTREDINAHLKVMYFERTADITTVANRAGNITWILTPPDSRAVTTKLQAYTPLYNSNLTYLDRLYYANDSYEQNQIKNLGYVGVDSNANPVFNYMVVDPDMNTTGELVSTNFKINYLSGLLEGGSVNVLELPDLIQNGTPYLATVNSRQQINLENTLNDNKNPVYMVSRPSNRGHYEGTVTIDREQLETTAYTYKEKQYGSPAPIHIAQVPVGSSDRWGGPTTYTSDLGNVQVINGGTASHPNISHDGGQCYGFTDDRMSIESKAFIVNDEYEFDIEFYVKIDAPGTSTQMLLTTRSDTGYSAGQFYIQWVMSPGDTGGEFQWGIQGESAQTSSSNFAVGVWHKVNLQRYSNTGASSTPRFVRLRINNSFIGNEVIYPDSLSYDTLYFGRLGTTLPLYGAIDDFTWRVGKNTFYLASSTKEEEFRNNLVDVFSTNFNTQPLAYSEDPFRYEQYEYPVESYANYAYRQPNTLDRRDGTTRYQLGSANGNTQNVSPNIATQHQNLDSQSTADGGKKKLLKAVKTHTFDGVNDDIWSIDFQGQLVNYKEDDSDTDTEYQTNITDVTTDGVEVVYDFNGQDNYVTIQDQQFERDQFPSFTVDTGGVSLNTSTQTSGTGCYDFSDHRMSIEGTDTGDDSAMVIRADDDFEFEFYVKINSGSTAAQMILTNRPSTGYVTGDFYIQWTGSTQKFQWGIQGTTTQTTASTFNFDQWHRIQYQRLGGGVSLIVNGAPQGSSTSYSGQITSGNTNPFYIGRLGTILPLIGSIDKFTFTRDSKVKFFSELDSIPPKIEHQDSGFKIELDLKLFDNSADQMIVTNRPNTGYTSGQFYLQWLDATNQFQWGIEGKTPQTSSGTFSYGQYYDIVLVRSGTELELFVDTVSQGVITSADTAIQGDTIYIGLLGSALPLKGYLNSISVKDGVDTVITTSGFTSFGGEPKLGTTLNLDRAYFGDILGAWALVYGGSDDRAYLIYTKSLYSDVSENFADRGQSSGLFYRKITIADDLSLTFSGEVEIVSQSSGDQFGWKISADAIRLGANVFINIVVADGSPGVNAHVYAVKFAYS